MKNRIDTIIQTEQHSASSFADAIGVSRSSMNHILNGRNNPSLDVISRILTTFPEYNSDWLLFGKEPRFKEAALTKTSDLFAQPLINPKQESVVLEKPKENDFSMEEITPKAPIINNLDEKKTSTRKIAKIIVLYTDNTFETLTQNS